MTLQSWRFYTHVHMHLFSCARVSWECTSSKSNLSQLPSPRLKTSSSAAWTGVSPGTGCCTKTGGWRPRHPNGNGLQPMNTKHGEATGTHKPVTDSIYIFFLTKSTQMSDVKTSKPGCEVLKLWPLPLSILDRQTDLTDEKT